MDTRYFIGTDEAWDALVKKYDGVSGAFLQSAAWDRVLRARESVTVRLLDNNGEPSLWVRLRIAPLVWVWYCPKGPLALPHHDEWRSIIDLLQKKKHASILRIEPKNFEPLTTSDLRFLRRRDVSPAHSLVTDISQPEAALLSTFHEKTRYNIRVAEKHGVTVRRLSIHEALERIEKIMWLFAHTGGRHHINQIARAELEPALQVCDVWVAEHGGELIAAALLLGFGTTMTYVHGASNYERRNLMAPYALHWAALCDARQHGYTRYDWWGIAPTDAPQHRLAGVTRFKMGFGGTAILSAGTFDAIIDRVRGTLYTVARHRTRS